MNFCAILFLEDFFEPATIQNKYVKLSYALCFLVKLDRGD